MYHIVTFWAQLIKLRNICEDLPLKKPLPYDHSGLPAAWNRFQALQAKMTDLQR